MYVPLHEVLLVAPPTLYRQGLEAMLREAWPGTGVTLATDSRCVPPLLYRRRFAVVILDAELLDGLPDLYLSQLRASCGPSGAASRCCCSRARAWPRLCGATWLRRGTG